MITKRSKLSYITDQFRVLFPAIILLCGIMIVAGVFLQWFHVSVSMLGFSMSYSASGWEMAMQNRLWLQIFTYFVNKTFPQAYYILSGGALLIICTLCASMIHFVRKEWLNITTKVQAIATVVAASYSFGIAIWFLVYGSDLESSFHDLYVSVDSYSLGYGFYISTIFSLMALIAGIIMTVKIFNKTKHDSKEGLLK